MDPVQVLAQSNPQSLPVKAELVVKYILDQPYVAGIVGTLAIALLARYMPALPNAVNIVLNNIFGQFVMLFVVAYMITRDAGVALISTLVVLIVVLGAKLLLPEYMKNVAQQEHRLVEPAPVVVKDGVMTEVAPLNSETVTEKVSDVDGYTNLWMYNEPVQHEDIVGSVEVAPTVSAATNLTASAVSSVAAPVAASMSMNVSTEVVEPVMPSVPTMGLPMGLSMAPVPTMGTPAVSGSFMDKFKQLKNSVSNSAANVKASLPNEINPDAISGIMSAKQTNLASL